MSRCYDMTVKVSGYAKRRESAIMDACQDVWNFTDTDFTPNYEQDAKTGKLKKTASFAAYGCSNLYGGESEYEFAIRLTRAIWEANGNAPCSVTVGATCLEDLPHNEYEFDETQFKKLMKGTDVQ